jgi:hypothetical protein
MASGSATPISIVGTPTAGQNAEWTGAASLQAVGVTGTGLYVKGTAPTLGNAVLTTPTVTVLDTAFTLRDDGDPTRQGFFQLGNLTPGATRVLTWPDFSGTIATLAGVEVFSNKILANAGFTTALTGPLLIGGTGTSSSLTLQSTAGVGATDSILFKVGNNGGTTAGLFDAAGNLGLGVTPSTKLHLLGASAELRQAGNSVGQTLCHQFYDNNVTLEGGLCYQGAAGTKSIALLSNASDGILLNNVNDVAMRFATNNTTRVSLTSSALSVGAAGGTNPAFLVDYSAGSVATGIRLTGTAAGTAPILAANSSGTNEGLQIDSKGSGDITLHKVSTGNLLLGGQTAHTVALARHLTANSAGNALTVTGGGATSGATDKAGGDLVLAPGVSTGTGRSLTRIQCAKPAVSTGTSDTALSDCVIFGAAKRVTNNTSTSMLAATVATNTSIAIQIDYAVESKDGAFVQQVEGGRVLCVATNANGTVGGNVCTKVGNLQGVSNYPTSTLDTTWTISAANPAVVSVTANSSLTPSTGFPLISMNTIHNLTSQTLVVQ